MSEQYCLYFLKHEAGILHAPLLSGKSRGISFYEECIICTFAAPSFHYEILQLEHIIIVTLTPDSAPLGLALPFIQFNTYVVLN